MSCFISPYNAASPKENLMERRVHETSVRIEEH